MLNKLSFNLMSELNESETRNFKIKKKVFMESDGVREEVLTEEENTFKYVYYPDEIKKILIDNINILTGGDNESEAEVEQQLDEELNNIKRIESESEITMIPQVNNDSFPGFKYGKVRTILKDGRTFISEENELPLITAIELTLSNLEESAPINSDLKKGKEDRLASLKMQLEKDGTQLADDEKKAIEEEIAQLESELQECDKPLKENEEVDQSTMLDTIYNSFYNNTYGPDLSFIQDFINCIDDYEGFIKFAELATQDDGIGNTAPDDILYEIMESYDDIRMFFNEPLDFLNYDKVKQWYKSIKPYYNESALNERYVEKFGGDSEDFVADVEVIKAALEAIDTDSFGAKLSQQMVWDWIETCDYQIEKGNRLTKGEFNESDKSLKEGFKLGEKAEIIDTCERRGQPIALVKLSKAGRYEYIVAFNYEVDDNDEVSWGYGYYYYDEESGKEAFEKVKAGGNLSESEKTEEKPIVEAAETEVKGLQVIKEQGNVYMLEDKSEGTRYIVGENYNLSEGEIENAEIYENKEEADKDYLNRCEVTTTKESIESENIEEGIVDNIVKNYQLNKASKAYKKGDEEAFQKAFKKVDKIDQKNIEKAKIKSKKLKEKGRKLQDKGFSIEKNANEEPVKSLKKAIGKNN